MNVVKNQVRALVCAEALAASKRHGPLHSPHEAWAILKEEVDEAEDEMRYLKLSLGCLWSKIKNDCPIDDITTSFIAHKAIRLACEAIQCAAVCKRIAEMEGKDCENH